MSTDGPLRVALEVSTLCEAQRTGTGRYALALLDALDRRSDVRSPRLLYRLSRWKKRHLRHAPERAWWYLEGLPSPPGLGCELVHGTDVRVPRWRNVVRVATLHDVFHILPFSTTWASPKFRARSQDMYARLARDADHIIADSAVTRDDFLKHYAFPAERMTVIPLGVSPAFVPLPEPVIAAMRARLGLTRPYVLHVGALAIRKNIPRLVEAFAAAGLQRDYDLVLAGPNADATTEIQAAISRTGIGDQVRRLDYVANDDLPPLYAGAAALAMPTFYEGFGLPVLEAMAAGTAVVTSNCGSTAEVGVGHAVLVDPHDTGAVADGLRAALALTPEQRAIAQRHASAFTWDAATEATVAVYRRALKER